MSLSSPRALFAGVILILALVIFWIADRSEKAAGIPSIQTDVSHQLTDIQLHSQALTNISIGAMSFTHALGDPPSIKGYCVYDAKQNGSSIDLRVYWQTESTNCQIMKIESHSTYSEPQVLWERH
jgi:hypothetical protein